MRALLVIAGAGLLMSAVAEAQLPTDTAAAAQPDEIIVQGEKNRKKRVRNFTRTLIPVRMHEQVGRFVAPVCPALLGLQLSQGEAIVDRFRQVAKAAGAPLAPKPCIANALIIAVPSKRSFIESMPRYAPGLVHGLSDGRIAALARSPAPASAWQVTGLLDRNGLQVANSDLEAGNRLTSAPTVASTFGGRINTPTQTGFAVSVLIVERKALADMSTRQFADYAALRMLAPINPSSDRQALEGNSDLDLPAESILALFDRDMTPVDAPPSLTWWDFAFLQAVYQMRMASSAQFQRGDIQARMEKILANVPADQR
jgi:hypothetical protein